MSIDRKKTVQLVLLAGAMGVLGVGIVSGCGGTGTVVTGLPGGKATMSQIALGRSLVISSGCGDCHSGGSSNPSAPNWLAGNVAGSPNGAFQLGPFTNIYAANLTPDLLNGLGSFSDLSIYNALKFGYDPMSPPGGPQEYLAPVMPWASFRFKSDAELWAVVAYIKHGIKANSNAVTANTGVPPDFWAGASAGFGPATTPSYPTANEVFNP